MEKYMLCLDESGNFDKDLRKLSKNPCLAGGLLYKNGDFSEAKAKGILDRCQEQSQQESINHATELDTQSKGLLTFNVLKRTKKHPVEFVIFEDDIRLQVIDSTITYLTVVTEGIIQLLKYLTFQNAGPVELNVLVGYRKDTAGEVVGGFIDGYIPLDAYKQRLEEKLKVEKAKTGNTWISSSRLNLSLGDDKRVSRLVLCDYVCNFWFTRTAAAFDVTDGKQPVRNILLSFYNRHFVFPLFTREEDDHVHRMVTDGTYADALFESFCGLLSDKNDQIIRRNFSKMPEVMIGRHLESLSGYIQDVIDVQRDLTLGLKMLENAEQLIAFLKKKNIPCMKFELDVKLYLLAIYNHQTRLSDMEALFEATLPLISDYTRKTLDMDYYFMFFNRMAVYLQDVCNYSKSLEICQNLEASVATLFSAASVSEYITYPEEEFCSEQLGKILGTEVQAITFLLRQMPGEELYQKAAQVSDKAMAQFFVRQDLERQYQYRAQLESEAGHFKEALEWLERYFTVPWKTWLSSENCRSFGVMHLAKLASDCCLSGEEKWQELGLEIASAICQTFLNSNISYGYPEFLILLRTGRALCSCKDQVRQGLKLLERLAEKVSCGDEAENVVSRLIGLEGLLECAQAAGKWKLKEAAVYDREFLHEYEGFLSSKAPNSMKNAVRPWSESIKAGEYEACRRIY